MSTGITTLTVGDDTGSRGINGGREEGMAVTPRTVSGAGAAPSRFNLASSYGASTMRGVATGSGAGIGVMRDGGGS
ncbi:hypothetical protein KRMM14A1259_22870 [Krasilnikovia sp. MM14-A1259]